MTYKANGCEYHRIKFQYAIDYWIENTYAVFIIDLKNDTIKEIESGKDFDFEPTRELFCVVDLNEYIN